MEEFTEGTLAVVFFGDNFVELSDGGVTLQDVCEAFGTPYGAGVFVADKTSRQPVATLPFDPVFTLRTSAPAEEGGVGVDLDDDDEPVMLELICPGGGSGAAAPSAAVPNGVKREPGEATAEPDGSVIDVDVGASLFASAADAAADDPSMRADTMDVVMRELVRLGAVELLSADSAQRVAQLPSYDAKTSPGLLQRIIYPAAQYSPYRLRRDPLQGTANAAAKAPRQPGQPDPSAHTRLAAFGTFQRGGAPYMASLDAYGMEMPTEDDVYDIVRASTTAAAHGASRSGEEEEEERVSALLARQRPDLTPLSADQLSRFFA